MLFRIVSVLALSLAGVLGAQTTVHAKVDAYSIESWHVSYEIGTDNKGRSYADVVETVTPVFPDFDQNRGLVRGVPLESFGASSKPRDVRVTDETGANVPFWVEEDDTFAVILIGDDNFVQGKQTYVISYQIRDVIAPFPDEANDKTGVDEFFWDLVPLERKQAIDSFAAEITFTEDLAAELTGSMRCYQGGEGSENPCKITAEDDTVTIPAVPLKRGEGVTVAVGLNSGSVVQPPSRTQNLVSDVLPFFISGAGAVLAGVAGLFIARHKKKAKVGRGVIIAQYDVPQYLPPLISSPIVEEKKDPVAAEFIHLSVRGAVQMSDGPGNRPIFSLINPALATDPLDQQALQSMSFNQAGNFQVPRQDTRFSTKMTELKSAGVKAAFERGYLKKETNPTARLLGFISLGLLVLGFLAAMSGAMVSRASSTAAFAVSIVLGVVGLVFVYKSVFKSTVFTPFGAETREYLLGVKEFIRVAEADRLQMLQSYTGAERDETMDGAGTQVQTIQIYEHLLPYAILFGLERQWSKVLQVKYQEANRSPNWYPGYAVAGMYSLSNNVNNFTKSITSAASYTSSSSGGSSGGGFSGGGGGGGFSGGR